MTGGLCGSEKAQMSGHRGNRKRPVAQGSRPLRSSERRLKIERLFAWLLNYGGVTNRWERHSINLLRVVHLGCISIPF